MSTVEQILYKGREHMRQKFEELIWDTIEKYCREQKKENIWRHPIVRFADARDKRFEQLKELVVSDHYLPSDYLKNAVSVLSYFIPFKREISAGNKDGFLSSQEWADAYLVTNDMFGTINDALVSAVRNMGYDACPPADAGMISQVKPYSRWSQRHVAYIAGHGTFGLNNMLISDKGSVGRYASVIMSLPVDADPVPTEERCLYKKDGGCGLCVSRCEVGALKADSFDRMKCLDQCMKNYEKYPGADVCGKCIVELPCSFLYSE